ncbi:hypothetical protein STA3757_03850 [Stanieria sp. NIES-3757]|nr:hypothetical protein STA3757_03850 [Stanieria sp. NIES-3757]
MANKTVIGKRVVVKLPWKGVTNNKDQYVKMKKPVAKALGFTIAKTSELYYEVSINEKDKTGEKVGGKQTIKRPIRAGYKQRSFTLVFDKQIGNLEGNSKAFKSLTFPVTTSVSIYDVIKHFEGKTLNGAKPIQIITDKGQSYPLNAA